MRRERRRGQPLKVAWHPSNAAIRGIAEVGEWRQTEFPCICTKIVGGTEQKKNNPIKVDELNFPHNGKRWSSSDPDLHTSLNRGSAALVFRFLFLNHTVLWYALMICEEEFVSSTSGGSGRKMPKCKVVGIGPKNQIAPQVLVHFVLGALRLWFSGCTGCTGQIWVTVDAHTPTQCVDLPVQRAPCKSSGQARDPPAIAHVRLQRRRLQFCGWRSRSVLSHTSQESVHLLNSRIWVERRFSQLVYLLIFTQTLWSTVEYWLGGRMFTRALILDSLTEILSEVRWNRHYSLFVHGWR